MSLVNSSDFLRNFSVGEINGKGKHFYQFGSFRLDVKERQLLHNGVAVPLQPKVFDVLAVLVERSGHLVEKDELLRIVWSDSFVEEANIARIVHTLRKILGEDENGNKFIETVAKKGYRFVAEIDEVHDTAQIDENGDQNSSAAEKLAETDIQIPQTAIGKTVVPIASKSKHKIQIILFTIGFLSVISLIFLYVFNHQYESPIKSDTAKSIAVLPVKPINTDNRELIYELGIAESLILKLSSAKELTVRPLSATRKYLEINQNPIEAGKEQQADLVLSSNYQIADNKILVTSQLINIQTGSVEEVFKSEKDTANKFSMQDAVANEIGNTLLARFGSRENIHRAERGTTNEEAYRLYLQAIYIFEEWNEPEIGKAIKNLEQAVKLDPTYAQAYVQLAYAYQSYQWSWRADIVSEEEYYLKSKKTIEKALALDENSADAHAVLGFIKSGYERDFAGAEKEYQRAIDLDPDSGMAHGLYASYLMFPGRFDEALAEEKKAIDIDPTYVVNYIAYGMILYSARRYPEAAAHFKKMLEKYGNTYFPYNWLWIIGNAQENEPEAYEWYIKYLTQTKTDPETIRLFQRAYQKSGWKGILREKISQDEQILVTDKDPDFFYEIACFSAQLGNKDKAFDYLDKAYERRRSSLNFIKVDPSLDSLRGDAGFERLVKRIGLS